MRKQASPEDAGAEKETGTGAPREGGILGTGPREPRRGDRRTGHGGGVLRLRQRRHLRAAVVAKAILDRPRFV